MINRGLGVVASIGLSVIVGCGGEAAAGPPDFASGAVPSASPVATTTAAPQTSAADETDAVLAAYAEYVIESDRFFDESIAQAAAAGAYAGSPELDAILDAVAVGRIREFDMETPMVLWEEGGVATTGTPVVVSAEVTNVDVAAGTAELRTCTDLRSVNYMDASGDGMKPDEIFDFLLEDVEMIKKVNPQNEGVERWYVENRLSEQVELCA